MPVVSDRCCQGENSGCVPVEIGSTDSLGGVSSADHFGPGMGYAAEIIHRHVHLSGFQMGMSRAPKAEVDDGATAASVQKRPAA